MANFRAQIVMVDDLGREVAKTLETETPVLATAIAAVADLLTDLAAVVTLGVVKVNYSNADTSGAFAATAGSNRDVGATFRLRTTDGGTVSYKIPGFDQALAAGDGSIDPDGAEVAAYFANFLAAGAFTLADGETITDVITGQMDK